MSYKLGALSLKDERRKDPPGCKRGMFLELHLCADRRSEYLLFESHMSLTGLTSVQTKKLSSYMFAIPDGCVRFCPVPA